MPVLFSDASKQEINQSLLLAEQAFNKFRKLDGLTRAKFLEKIGNEVEKNSNDIVTIAQNETCLGKTRLEMELSRTVSEIHTFAKLARSEEWHNLPSQSVGGKINAPRLITNNIPIGPVLVIGACNFPLAISVIGTDTISALSVGCTVVVKAHPAHPQTCQFLADIVIKVMKQSEIPLGTFQLIHGQNYKVTQNLVTQPYTSCVAFTGSLRGGAKLSKLSSQRKKPIPFHGEMGSLNPVIALPHKVEQHPEQLASDYIQAVTLFAGQMCTKPGALFIIDSNCNTPFLNQIKENVERQEILPMLNSDVYENFEKGVHFLKQNLSLLATNDNQLTSIKNPAYCRIFELDSTEFIQNTDLRTEAFGPASLLIKCKDENSLFQCIDSCEGSLTASIHCSKKEYPLAQRITQKLESKVGRMVWNGFPPGVTPGPATHHGGPWPASTNSRYTSIGKEAYQRFIRPVCRQGFPVN